MPNKTQIGMVLALITLVAQQFGIVPTMSGEPVPVCPPSPVVAE